MGVQTSDLVVCQGYKPELRGTYYQHFPMALLDDHSHKFRGGDRAILSVDCKGIVSRDEGCCVPCKRLAGDNDLIGVISHSKRDFQSELASLNDCLIPVARDVEVAQRFFQGTDRCAAIATSQPPQEVVPRRSQNAGL